MIDYRQENRLELFKKWYAWSLKFKDCDPAIWMTNYVNDRFEHNSEQRIWFAWLYGNTYNLPTAWVAMNEFPDYELATVDRMENWNRENIKRLRYQNDTKWSKGHIAKMFESYKKDVGDGLQRDFFEKLYGNNEKQNFDNIWNHVMDNWFKFGRYATWFTLQHMKHTAGIDMEPTSMMFSDFGGSKTQRNGWAMALGKDDWVNKNLTAAEYQFMEDAASDFITNFRVEFPELARDADFFSLETCNCSFFKIFRTSKSRYLGYYLDRQFEEIKAAEGDGWYGIEWNVLHQARSETLDPRVNRAGGIDKSEFPLFVEQGILKRFDYMFDDKPAEIGLEAFFA